MQAESQGGILFTTDLRTAFGLPGFYGRNMNAWMDCMTHLGVANADMSSIHVVSGDVVVLCISAVTDFRKRRRNVH